jgi:hypothetical protein
LRLSKDLFGGVVCVKQSTENQDLKAEVCVDDQMQRVVMMWRCKGVRQ